MNTKRWLMASVAAFAFIFVSEFVVHGVLLQGLYEATSQLWRSHEDTNMAVMFMSQCLFAAGLAWLFTRNYEAGGIGEGLRFGLYVGVVLGAIELGKYAYMPVPGTLVAVWVASAMLIKGVGAGTVLSLVYRKA